MAWLLVQQPADLTDDEHAALDKLQKAVAEIATAYTLAQDFVRMMRERTVDALADWITRAAASCVAELCSFATGLQRDLAAVTAGLSLPWSNGQMEGQINRLKLIKRMMYGRATSTCFANECWHRLSPTISLHAKCGRTPFRLTNTPPVCAPLRPRSI